MSEPLLIPCPSCNAQNRIAASRLTDQPRCGRCKHELLPGQPFALDAGNFHSQLRGPLPLLVDVWADWCGPCKAFAPTFRQAAGQLQGRVRLATLDSQAQPQLAGSLGIRSIPSLLLFRDGKEIARQSGALPLPQLLDWVQRQL